MLEILDHDWRWDHLYFIRSEEGIVRIRQRPDQREIDKLVYPAFLANEPLDIIILKNRQRGTTTKISLLCLDCTAYYPAKVANTLADTRDRAGTIFDNVVKLAWERIPDGLKPAANRDNVNALDFTASIGSKYIISASKSEPVDILHTSEAPYFPDEGKITEAEQMVRRNGIKIMESTAFGMGNLFEKRFTEAWTAQKAGKRHHRTALFYPWYTDPTNTTRVYPGMELLNKAFIEVMAARIKETAGYELSDEQKFFYDQKMIDLGDEVFQFYPTEPEEAFLHSGRPVFDLVVLKELEKKHARRPIRMEQDFEIYEEPDEEKTYGIGVDTAEGLEHGDNSSITVVCKETGQEVAQCTGKIDEEELAEKLGIAARMFDKSSMRMRHLAIIERNNHGHAVIAYAKKDTSIRLWQRETQDQILDKTSAIIGWDTNERSKAIAISTLRKDLGEGYCIPRSYETYSELQTFVKGERGKMGGMPGKHDDRVISLALANLACREIYTLGTLDPAAFGLY